MRGKMYLHIRHTCRESGHWELPTGIAGRGEEEESQRDQQVKLVLLSESLNLSFKYWKYPEGTTGAVTAKSLKPLKAPGTASGISGLSGKQKSE